MKDSKDEVGPFVRVVNLCGSYFNVDSQRRTQGMGVGNLSVRLENFVGSYFNVGSR